MIRQFFLDRNENQYGPSPLCFEVLRTANLQHMSLYSRTFTTGKKSELSDRLSSMIGIPEDRVLLSYGSEDMLKQVVHCYLGGGQTIFLPRQSWWYYKKVAAEISGNSVEYPIIEGRDGFQYDVSSMMSLYDTCRPEVVLIASPSNPTGNCIDDADLERFLVHCSSSVVVLDQAYHGFSGESVDHLKELVEGHERLIVLRTFSKYYALAGLRIGYACVGKRLDRIVRYSARYLGYNQLTEKIALAALDSGDYYRQITAQIREDNAAYYDFFVQLPGFKPFRTRANFILVRYPLSMKAGLQSGLHDRGVIVKFLQDPGLEDCMRITTGTRDQNGHVIHAFREVVGELTGVAAAGHTRS